MKRNLNEQKECCVIKLNISAMAADYDRRNFNDLRDRLTAEGAEVDGEKVEDKVFMIIKNLDRATVEEVMAEFGLEELEEGEYIQEICDKCDNKADDHVCPKCGRNHCSCEECPEEKDFPDYDEVEECGNSITEDDDLSECDNLKECGNKLEEDDDISEITDDDDNDNESPLFENDEDDNDLYNKCCDTIQGCIDRNQMSITDDIEDNMYELVQFIGDPDKMSDEEFDHVASIMREAWDDIASDASNLNDEDFPSYEDDDEYSDKNYGTFEKMKHHRIEEKKKGCCPTKKSLYEALVALDDKD